MASNTKRLPKVTQYVKNVGKSVVFASVEGIKQNAPGMTSFVEDNDEIFRNIYSSVKNYKATIKNADRSIKQSNIFKSIDYGIKNIMEDVKEGNFYNTSRTRDISEKALGIDEEALGDFFDFDESDSYESSDNIGNSEKYLSDSFDQAIGQAASKNATIVARGTDMVVKGTKASTTILSGEIQRSTATLHSGIGALYNSTNRINQFLNGPMMAHLNNSKMYYEESLSVMKDQQAMIKELLEMQRNLYKAEESRYSRSSSKLDNVMNYDGSMNLGNYSKHVKDNVKNMMEMYGMFGDMGVDMSMVLASAPIAFLLNGVMDGLMPKNFKKSLKSLDSSMTTLFSQFITKMNKNKNSSNGLVSLLGEIFGVNLEDKKSINTGNYNKGPVPFDGITRKTIIEVIPGYLARIESALTGSAERHYDPYNGKWKNIKDISSDFDKERLRAIRNGNYDIVSDTGSLIKDTRSRYGNAAADDIEKSIHRAMEKIFEDGGYFDPSIIKDSKSRSNAEGKRRRVSSGDAWKRYGFRNKAQFDLFLSSMSDNTFRNIAANNMRARQSYARSLEDYEASGGVYNNLFNGAYSGEGGKISSFTAKNSLLNLSKDQYGNNIFYYLREILYSISSKRKKNRGYKGPKNKSTTSNSNNFYSFNTSNDREHSDSSESEGDPGYSDDIWNNVEEDIRKEEEKKREDEEKHKTFGSWVKKKFVNSKVGVFVEKSLNGFNTILDKPLEYMTKMLDKADQNMFMMMFGEKELRDAQGNKVTSIFDYIINKVKKSFDDLSKWIKAKLHTIFNPLWEKIKPTVDKYGRPIVDELKGFGKKAVRRTKSAFSNTFGRIFSKLPKSAANNIVNGGVSSADDITDGIYQDYNEDFDDNIDSYDDIINSAMGRIATKRGLTMISPGEMIIPASFDKNKQNKMLRLEKRDRSRIYDAIGLNAKGNVDTKEYKDILTRIFNENKAPNSAAKVGAGGIIGAGAGLLTGINPLLGAMAGAGISILNNSETLQKMVFGEEINGKHEGGIIPKNIQDYFKKALPDMTDFGIVGGALGLITPFGPLGGAAIGASLGLLKNSESFKKFIFGDEASGKEGLLDKEAYDKFEGMVKKAAPNMLIGAGAGILAGPFGLLGNAAMGAGLGLLSSTDEFHNFIFGNKEEGTAGVLDAFNTGIVEPAKEKMLEFAESFKSYAKKNIIEPMKNFWSGFSDMIKNTITNTSDKIKDYINDMFERTIGLPMHDFLQEKVFKPIGNIIFKLVKAPLAIGKLALAAPFRAFGAIGNTMIANQIRRGTKTSMSASERLAWRDKHNIRFNAFNAWRDKTLQEDEMLAGMTEDQLKEVADNSIAGLQSFETLQKRSRNAHKAVGQEISGFFNTNTADGKNRFTRVGYNDVKKITELAQTGKLDKAYKYIKSLRGLSDEERNELKNKIEAKADDINRANSQMDKAHMSSDEMDEAMSRLIGRKFKGRNDRRQLYKSAEAELKARSKASVRENETPEVSATNNFAELYKDKTNSVIDQLKSANAYLKRLVDPEAEKHDTTPPGDKKAEANEHKEDSGTENVKNAIHNVAKTESAATVLDPITGNFITSNPDAKENVDNEEERKRITEEDTRNRIANEKTNTIMDSIKNALIGNKDKSKPGFISKLLGKMGKFGKFIGMTGLSLVGFSLFGHATQWLKVSVWPKMKEFLFGTTKDDGTQTKGLLGGIVDGGKRLFLGDDGKSGVLSKIKNWIDEKVTGIKTWYESEGGFTGILMNKAVPGLIRGWGYAINNVVTPLTAVLVKAFFPMMFGLGKAILQGLKISLKKEVPRKLPNIDIDSNTGSILKETQNSVNSSIESDDNTGIINSVKNSFKLDTSNYDMNKYTFDMNSIFNLDQNDEKSNNPILGALGQTQRTNNVEFDENGNPITTYSNWNTNDTVLSRIAKGTGRGFLKGLSGMNVSTKRAETIGKYAIKGVENFAKPGVFGKVKSIGNFAHAGFNSVRNVLSISKLAGKSVNKSIQNMAKNGFNAAAENVTKQGIFSGIKAMFKTLENSSIVAKILECASMFTGKSISKSVIVNALEGIANKLGRTLIGRATKVGLKGLSTIIAKFSPLALATIVMDFVWGFDNAYTILGIAKGVDYNVNLGQKCVCGLTNLLTQNLTLGIISADEVIDMVVDYIFPIFNLNAEKLKKAQEESDNILTEWNKYNPTNQADNIEDYNNKQKWWYKLTKPVSDAINNVFGSKNKGSTSHRSSSGRTHGGSGGGFGRSDYGFGRSHLNQSDPRISKMRYGNGTIGDSGCAPVAATNLINNLNKYGNSVDVEDAAKFAERNRMITSNGGTSIKYFNSYLGSKGIPTKTTDNKNDIMNALYNGNQVIMLGRDTNNRPGAPFGDTPHYVTATAISPKGNIIVEDPDLPQGSVEYKPEVMMNSMVNSVIAKTSRKRKKKLPIRRNRPVFKTASIPRSVKKTITSGRGSKLGAQAIINVAKSQIGVTESGDNVVKYNYAYYDSKHKNYAWCVTFVWWVFNQAGASKLFMGGGKTAACGPVADYYSSRGKFDTKNPKMGDLIIFDFDRSDSYRYEHIGIVYSVDSDGTVTTIEGNYSNKVGVRVVKPGSVRGYCHIDYPYTYDASSVVDMHKWGDDTDYESIAKQGTYSSSESNANSGNEKSGGTLLSALTDLGTSMIKAIYGKDAYEALFGMDTPNDYNNTVETTESSKLSGNSVGQQIWNYMTSRGYSAAGTAGMMGNLDAESGLRPNNLENSRENSLGSDSNYTSRINNRYYSKNSFSSDKAGYGLAQWTYGSRKRGLYESTIEKGRRIDDLSGQLDYLIHELESDYSRVNSVLKNTNNLNHASDIVLREFERPAVLNYNDRRNRSLRMMNTYGSGGDGYYADDDYYDSDSISNSSRPEYADKKPLHGPNQYTNFDEGEPEPSKPKPNPPRGPGNTVMEGYGRNSNKYSNVTGSALKALNSVNSRTGSNGSYTIPISNNNSIINSNDYTALLRTIVEILISISNNTAILGKVLDLLSSNFDINIDKSEIEKATRNSRAQAERKINSIIERSGNGASFSKLINNKDTQYLVSAMTAIAKE